MFRKTLVVLGAMCVLPTAHAAGAQSLPTGWSSLSIGSRSSGGAVYANGAYTVTDAGSDIWGTADSFQFVYATATGDAQLVTRVASLQSPQTYAKAGLMFRDTVGAGSAHVILDVRPNGTIEFMVRPATGAATQYLAGGAQPPPAWLRLTRHGNSFTGDISRDAITWTTVGTTTAAIGTSALAGLAVTGHDVTRPASAVFDSVGFSGLALTGAAPAVYSAISDRNTYVKPPLPALGPAGFQFSDPVFGSPLLRVTDGQTRPGLVNRSFRVPSNAHLMAWNASSTAFYVVSNDGTVIPYAFNAATMTATRMNPAATGNGGLTLSFYVEPQFSLVNPNVIYGAASGTNNRTIVQYDFQAGTYSAMLNLDTIVGGLSGTYVGGMMTGGVPAERLLTFFGGASQDQHYYALWAPLGNLAGGKLLNTLTSTLNGVALPLTLNFHLHATEIDKSGRFVILYPTSVDLGSPRYAAKSYVWDTSNDTITPMTTGVKDGGPNMHPSGHDAAGYGHLINQDCCTSSSWDAAQWQSRLLTALADTIDLISPVLPVKEVYLADHSSWNNAQPQMLMPIISSTYRYGNNTVPWRAWDDEIIAVQTAVGTGATVWRFAHHRSLVGSDANPLTPYFWYEPIVNVSPDGRWAVFTSNWEKTLGKDSAEGTSRQDVFLVQLAHP